MNRDTYGMLGLVALLWVLTIVGIVVGYYSTGSLQSGALSFSVVMLISATFNTFMYTIPWFKNGYHRN